MSLRLCVLASGSSANCIYVASDRTRILIDAGLSVREIGRRLESIGVDVAGLSAICVTHEHDDHISSVGALHRLHGLSLYANAGTVEGVERGGKLMGLPWQVFLTGSSFPIGDLTVEPFSVPHDSYDPVGFSIAAGESRVGIVTDAGISTGLIRERLKHCQAIVLESNHDEQLLQDSKRPWALKQRIRGRQGHLSNTQAGEMLADIAGPSLRVVILAHLSAQCNRPELAVATVQKALAKKDGGHVAVKLTYADRASDVVDI